MKHLLIIFLLVWAIAGQTQSISGGFKAGLNFSRFEGPSETGPSGDDLEEFSLTTGFHVGGMVNFKFSDQFGIRSEIMYTQMGTEYQYDGPSYLRLFTALGEALPTTGERRIRLTVNNGYVSIPISGYARLGPLEFSAGVYGSILLASTGSGEWRYTGVTPAGQNVQEVLTVIDARYLRDEFQQENVEDFTIRALDNRAIQIPNEVGGYYDTQENDENLYRTLDFGILGGLSVYLNQGLFLGLRASYGLSDVTNENQDIYYRMLGDDGLPSPSEDKDRNFSLQTSIGFSF